MCDQINRDSHIKEHQGTYDIHPLSAGRMHAGLHHNSAHSCTQNGSVIAVTLGAHALAGVCQYRQLSTVTPEVQVGWSVLSLLVLQLH